MGVGNGQSEVSLPFRYIIYTKCFVFSLAISRRVT